MRVKLSITISTWKNTNIEYLKFAIDTILAQTFQDLEIVIVNDGADEKVKEAIFSYRDKVSVDYCDNLNAKIRYIETQKAFGGTAQARNVGLRNAQGEFIHFHDSDDYFNFESSLKDIFNEINESTDVFVFSYVNEGHPKICKQFKPIDLEKGISEENKKDFADGAFFDNYSSWNKIFRRRFLTDNNLYFDEKFRMGEDFEHHFRWIFLTKNVKFTKNLYYVYRFVEKSISRGYNKWYIDNANVLEKIKSNLVEFKVYDDLRLYFVEFFVWMTYNYSIDTMFKLNEVIKSKKILRKYFEMYNITDEDMDFFSKKDKNTLYWLL